MDPEAIKRGQVIIPTPKWFIALRALQIVLGIILVGLTGWWIHGLYYDELGFVIVCGIFTWIIAAYALLSEKVPACQRAYNTWAVLALDLLMVIFWLAAMGATAQLRSRFTIPVSATCVSDGSAINSGRCTVWKRAGVATNSALAVLSGIAGLSALAMLLFVPTFAYVCHYFRLSFAARAAANDPEKNPPAGAVPGVPNPATELQTGLPPPSQPQPDQHQWGQPPQSVYPVQQPPAGAPPFQQGPVYDPYAPQNAVYGGAAGTYPPQQPYIPTGTPAPGQHYTPQGTPAPGPVYQPPAQ
ncbi:hypothetical protein GGS23DRAFT_608250 [Durotheca rogersii]|uniref:uncharacterized protein n=1 Tax=Durotheca rogersii TaxID=419775 RepID=UPI00221FC06E|nr:uncharacterized protein GGS23DRAFT_608250 [Durotheca rogersii]KAI5855042.1 hypothetical protein GGS23DRAFT_608250 [Durotheca rogersii]